MSWYWADGSVVQYTNWAVGEPNNLNEVQECGQMFGSSLPGMWDDVECTYERQSICRMPVGKYF